MLEQTIERLTVEVQKLREAIEEQTVRLEHVTIKDPAAVRNPAPPRVDEVFVTERVVADLAGLSVAVLRRWRVERKGPPFRKIGRLVRYSRAEVIAWLDARGDPR